MTDYKTIFGKNIRLQTSDLTMSTATEGELFYSDSDKEFKVGIGVLAWSAGGSLNGPRDSLMTGDDSTQTAGIVFGGHIGPGMQATTETYDGSSWTEVGDLNTARQLGAGAGTQTSALCAGGKVPPGSTDKDESEEYDGSSWTEGNDMGTARYGLAGAGSQTAAVVFGGYVTAVLDQTEEYDGTSWSEVNDLNTAKYEVAGCGSQTAALGFGGYDTASSAVTEEYDGTNWTASNNLNTARRRTSGGGAQTDALCFGGLRAPSNTLATNTERYDGTSWTAVPSMGTARYYLGGLGASGTAGLAMGGLTSGSATAYTDATEEFSATITLKTLTDS
jgi:hypothetical protein